MSLIEQKRKLEDLAGEIADMDYSKFTEGEDYASLAKRYSTQGKKAMDDTIGKVAARTGGLASSYATAAGNQAYSGYMEKLEDAARAMYDDQRQEKIDQFGIEKSIYDSDVANDQWQQKFIADQTQRADERADKMISDEKTALASEFYFSPYAYATFADYKKAFPNTLLTESDFNQIKGTSIGQYNDDNKKFTVEAKEDEEKKLYNEFYNNINAYESYVDYKKKFPKTLLTGSEFAQILNTARGDYDRDNKNTTEGKAYNTIVLMLKNGTPLSEIDEQLINNSGYDMQYWTAIEQSEKTNTDHPVLDMSGEDVRGLLQSGMVNPSTLATYEKAYGESYVTTILRDRSYAAMSESDINQLCATLDSIGREEEADALGNAWLDYHGDAETHGRLLKDRTFTATNDGGDNGGGGINRDAYVTDEAGNEYRLSDLIGALVSDGSFKTREEARKWIEENQARWGVNT